MQTYEASPVGRKRAIIVSLCAQLTLLLAAVNAWSADNAAPSARAETAPPTAAQWIWATPDRDAQQTAYFRKTFALEKPIKLAMLRALADFNRMTVYLNGRRAAEIAEYGQPSEIDVTAHLQSGENLLAICGAPTAGPAAVALVLEVTFQDGARQTIVSDTTWLITLAANAQWREAAFNADDWGQAAALGTLAVEPWSAVASSVVINEFDDYTQWKQALGASAAADPAAFLVPPDFKLELLRTAQPDEGSWISMTFDPRGRLIVAKESQGVLRITLPDDAGAMRVETINDALKECRGVLSAFDCLYVNANESKGLYRLRDTKGDDLYDGTTLLYPSVGGAGHGRNDLTLGPDNKIYSIHGDNVELPADAVDRTSPFGERRRGAKTREGHVLRMDRVGKQREVVASGLRNPYGIDFNTDGEMFTYDADAEFDMGAPWYRPTRVDHLVSGADFGWRGGSGNWPPYYADHPDNAWPSLDIGKGSPTGVKFGTRSRFPPAYQQALFILDWAYGRILAVHMAPRGASYVCRAETFVKGRPLNVTDLEFGPDGALYFVTGGRKTQSGLYRLSYVGSPVEAKPPTPQQAVRAAHAKEARALRHHLESFHGRHDTRAVAEAWPHLDSVDPWIRYAARIAVEHQPLPDWQERALTEKRPTAALAALTALARSGDAAMKQVVARLDQLPLAELTAEQLRDALYGYRLCLPQLKAERDAGNQAASRLEAVYPHESSAINRELSLLLAELASPPSLRKTLDLLAAAATQQEQMHYLYVLGRAPTGWSLRDRRAYLESLRQTARFQGGHGMPKFLLNIETDWLATLSDAERAALAPLLAKEKPPSNETPLPAMNRPLVKDWRADDLLSSLPEVGQGRHFEQGKTACAMLCLRCHRVENQGAAIGPDLTSASRRFSRRDLLESVLSPSKVIAEQYRNVQVITLDGQVIVGRIVPATDFRSPLLRIATNLLEADQITEIPKNQIELQVVSEVSPMPQGLLNVLTREEILDLLAYLEAAGDAQARNFKP